MKSSPRRLYLSFVYFLSLLELLFRMVGCWYSLSWSWGPVSVWLVRFVRPQEARYTFQLQQKISKKWEKGDWRHPKYQMMCAEKHAGDDPKEKRSHAECFQGLSGVKERSWVLVQMKDPLPILLHFIAFLLHFNCQLDLQWENYTMLVFCFIMLLFLIFQNIRNFILLYVMAENTSFLEVLQTLIPMKMGHCVKCKYI